MRVLAVGKAKPSAPESALFTRYATRIKPRLTLLEFTDGTGAPIEIKRREAETILPTLDPRDFVIALDQAGATPDSPALAKLLRRWTETARRLTFIIGGAEGLHTAIITRADTALSLGNLTWPHMLVRAMLAEQIYRAQMINIGHPYHRAGRPNNDA